MYLGHSTVIQLHRIEVVIDFDKNYGVCRACNSKSIDFKKAEKLPF